LRLALSGEFYERLRGLSKFTARHSIAEVFNLALVLFTTVYPAILRGERVYLVNRCGDLEREIIFPNTD